MPRCTRRAFLRQSIAALAAIDLCCVDHLLEAAPRPRTHLQVAPPSYLIPTLSLYPRVNIAGVGGDGVHAVTRLLQDVRYVLIHGGLAGMGLGHALGPDCGVRAAQAAITSTLLAAPIQQAKAALVCVRSGPGVAVGEIIQAGEAVTQTLDPYAPLVLGATVDPYLQDDEVEVTVVASGFEVLPDLPL